MNFIADQWKKTELRYKYAFISTVLFGIFSHGMMLFNKFSNHDDLRYFFEGGNTLTFGRWMLYLLLRGEKYLFGDGKFSLPLINGSLTIFCIGAALCLLISLLDIRSTTLCILLGGIMVSYPVVTCMLGYMFTAHYYGIGLFLSVLGPYLILKKDKPLAFLAGIIASACSVGVYQAFIPVTLCVFLFGLMKMFNDAEGREERLNVWKKAAFCCLSCALFMGLYLLIMKLSLRYSGAELSDYKNISSFEQTPLKVYLQRAVSAYKEFFLPARGTAYDLLPGNLRPLYYAAIAGILLLFAALLFMKRRDPLKVLILAFLVLWVPLGVNFIFVISGSGFFAMMFYGRVMLFVFLAWLIERTAGSLSTLPGRTLRDICLAILGLTVLMYCRFNNICYLRMEMMQSQAIRYFSTLVTRIQSTEGYNTWLPVSYIYFPHPGTYDNSIEEIPEFEYIKIHPYFGIRQTVGDNVWKQYLKYWCGYSAHEMDQSYFIDRPEVRAMPHYPDEGSIQVIDDTVVVKF